MADSVPTPAGRVEKRYTTLTEDGRPMWHRVVTTGNVTDHYAYSEQTIEIGTRRLSLLERIRRWLASR